MATNKRLVRISLFIGLTVVVTLVLRSFWKARSAAAPTPSISLLDSFERQGVPDFEAKTISGRSIRLVEFKGKVVLLNFWATWCGPCVDEIPSFIRLAVKLPSDVVLVLISEDSELSEINTFLKSFANIAQPNIYVVWDNDRKLMKGFGSERLPETFVLKRDHKLAKKVIGSIDWSSADAIEYIGGL